MKQPKRKPNGPKPTRRQFAKTLAVLAAAPFVAAAAPETAAGTKDALTATAKQLSTIADLRYGKFLSEEQKQSVHRKIASQLRSAERLRKFKFKNSDEPAFLFQAEVS